MNKSLSLQGSWMVTRLESNKTRSQLETFDPLFGYFCIVINELNNEDSNELTKDMLIKLRDFSINYKASGYSYFKKEDCKIVFCF